MLNLHCWYSAVVVAVAVLGTYVEVEVVDTIQK